eukprot:6313694-Lingulodinium_polyedra.AAC.1
MHRRARSAGRNTSKRSGRYSSRGRSSRWPFWLQPGRLLQEGWVDTVFSPCMSGAEWRKPT